LEAAIRNGLVRLNHDPKGLTVYVGFASRFRFTGGSLSGAVVIGTVAALEGRTLAPNMVLTGTVEPDGSLGPIADLEVKIAGAGAYTVLYPSSQTSTIPYLLGSQPVRTLQEARLLMLP
jgi:predicted S18 family serine protease